MDNIEPNLIDENEEGFDLRKIDINQNYNNGRENINIPLTYQNSTNNTTISNVKKLLFKVQKNRPKLPEINALTSMAELDCNINLREVALSFMNCIYNEKNDFKGVEIFFREPYAYLRLCSDGKFSCLGCKNENEAKISCRKLAKKIKSLGYNVKYRNFRIISYQTKGSTQFKISISKLAKYLVSRDDLAFRLIPYTKEFKRITVRKKKLKSSIVIHGNGTVMISGTKNQQQAIELFKELLPLLYKFKA